MTGLEENRISLSTVGSKQSFLTEAFHRVEHRYESGTASESAKRAQVFAGLYSSVHTVHRRTVSFGGAAWGLPDDCSETFWGFCRRARSLQSRLRRRCDNCISLEWSLLCCCARYSACMTVGQNSFQPPIKAAPQQCLQKPYFKFSRVCTAACEDFPFGESERLAKLSRLSPSSLTYVWAAAKIQNDSWRSATIGWSVCLRSALQLATCCMTVGRNWIWISRDPAKASRPRDLKIDSGEKSFPLEVANQLARYF